MESCWAPQFFLRLLRVLERVRNFFLGFKELICGSTIFWSLKRVLIRLLIFCSGFKGYLKRLKGLFSSIEVFSEAAKGTCVASDFFLRLQKVLERLQNFLEAAKSTGAKWRLSNLLNCSNSSKVLN